MNRVIQFGVHERHPELIFIHTTDVKQLDYNIISDVNHLIGWCIRVIESNYDISVSCTRVDVLK